MSSKEWEVVEKEYTHVVPIDDLIEHDVRGNKCECNPEIDWCLHVVVHNALDGRV